MTGNREGRSQAPTRFLYLEGHCMKPCTIYGCDAAAPRNSKVCFEHIKAGLLRNPLEVSLDRGAPSLTFTNHTDGEVKISATLYSNGGLWTMGKLISEEIDNEVLAGLVREANGLPANKSWEKDWIAK